jgi:hypothetical protein
MQTSVSIDAKDQKLYETARNIAHRCADANLFSVTDTAQMPFFIGPRTSCFESCTEMAPPMVQRAVTLHRNCARQGTRINSI